MIDTFLLLVRVICALVFILGLIYLTFKFGGGKLQLLQNKRYLKILERVPVSKDNNLLVVKMGTKAFVVASSQNKIEILREVPEEELDKIQVSIEAPKNDKLSSILKNWRKEEK